MLHGRGKSFKHAKLPKPFEVYENSSTETPETELVTTVYLPVEQ